MFARPRVIDAATELRAAPLDVLGHAAAVSLHRDVSGGAPEAAREPTGPSLFVAYIFWMCAGFSGLHRFYLRSAWGFVFIPVFLGILYVNGDIRDGREDVSRTRAAYKSRPWQTSIGPSRRHAEPRGDAARGDAQARETDAKGAFDAAAGQLAQRRSIARWLAILMAAMLLIDAVLLPGLVRRREVYEAAHPRAGPAAPVPDIPPVGTHEDPTVGTAYAGRPT